MSYTTKFPSIIIADDYALFRRGVISVIKSRNNSARFIETNSGMDVINILDKQHYSVVLMGVDLGELNGIESTSIVKEKFPKTKVIGVSVSPNAYYILEMFLRGADGFLLKNIEGNTLIDVIKKVVSGKSHFPEEMINKLLSKENGIIQHTISKKAHIQERLKETIYLICMGLSSKEIASVMNVSLKTVEHDRLELNRVMGSTSVVGIMKYGIMSGILEDVKLNFKFKPYFSQNTNQA